MRYLTIDSSVFISAVDPEDKFYSITREFFSKLNFENDRVIIPLTVILEIINILYRKEGEFDKIVEYFNQQPLIKIIPLDEYFYCDHWSNFSKFQLKVGDLIIALTSYFHQTQLITWDKQFLKNTKKLCNSQTPKEFLKNMLK